LLIKGSSNNEDFGGKQPAYTSSQEDLPHLSLEPDERTKWQSKFEWDDWVNAAN